MGDEQDDKKYDKSRKSGQGSVSKNDTMQKHGGGGNTTNMNSTTLGDEPFPRDEEFYDSTDLGPGC